MNDSRRIWKEKKKKNKISYKGILAKNLKMIRIDSKAANSHIDIKLSNSLRLLKQLLIEYGNTNALYDDYQSQSSDRNYFYKLMKPNIYRKQVKAVGDPYQVLMACLTNKFNRDAIAINAIKNKDFRASSKGRSGRLDTNLTNLSKDLHNFLYVAKKEDKKLVNVDLKNSQPFLLAVLLKERYRHSTMPEDVKAYIDLAASGSLYEFIMGKFNIPIDERDNFKKLFFANVLYGKVGYTKFSDEGKMFKATFPTVAEFIIEQKTLTDHKEAFKEFPILLP